MGFMDFLAILKTLSKLLFALLIIVILLCFLYSGLAISSTDPFKIPMIIVGTIGLILPLLILRSFFADVSEILQSRRKMNFLAKRHKMIDKNMKPTYKYKNKHRTLFVVVSLVLIEIAICAVFFISRSNDNNWNIILKDEGTFKAWAIAHNVDGNFVKIQLGLLTNNGIVNLNALRSETPAMFLESVKGETLTDAQKGELVFIVLFPIGVFALLFVNWKIKKNREAIEAEKKAQGKKAEEKRKALEAQEAEFERQKLELEEERRWQQAVAEHLVQVYECYGCGKTQTGKELDDIYKSNRNQSWYIEYIMDELHDIYRLPLPQPDITILRTYCNKCGKARERELELLKIELKKIKAINNQADAIRRNSRDITEKLEEQNRHMREQLEEQQRLARKQITATEEIARIEQERLWEEKYKKRD